MTTGTPLALAGGVFMLSGESFAREEYRFHTRIHEKQDNRLVLIAPTARWILRKRTDAQSAAVPMKLSYFNGRVV